uniref:ankyrin-1-like n=1 Tax=Styela clava TaxID=7725 RepID=UPI00193AB7C6|nr:ankyrin-1-like [Styela clava]
MNLSGQSDDCTNVYTAVKSVNIEVLKELLEHGKDYNEKDKEGWGPIHHAAYNGHFECVKIIFEKANSDYNSVPEVLEKVLSPSVYHCSTPLSLAAMQGHYEIVDFFADIYRKAEVHVNKMGFPLHKACRHGHNKCIEVLVKKLPQCINVMELSGWQMHPIHFTVEEQNLEGTKILLQNGADVNTTCIFSRTPLYLAVWKNNYEIVKLLADKVRDIDAYDDDDCTPLFLAVVKGYVEIVRCLLDNGADASKPADYGQILYPKLPCIPMDIAVDYRDFEIIKLLADGTPRDKGLNAVIHAALNGNTNCLIHLFDRGFPTFDSTTKIYDTLVWVCLLQECPDKFCAETIKILYNHGTEFQELAKFDESVCIVEIYLLPDVFADLNIEALKQFLNAGILEIRFEYGMSPDVESIINKHKNFQNDSSLKRDIPGILFCLNYFPFLTISFGKSEPTEENFSEGDLVQNIPSLLNLSRWFIRCLIIKKKGMVRQEYVESLKLPKKITAFLLHC